MGDKEKKVCPFCAKEVMDMVGHIKYNHKGLKDKKNYPCKSDDCDKMFRSLYASKVHYQTQHTNIKVECKICGTMVKNMPTHINQIHKNKDRFKCNHCDRAFNKHCDLRVHARKVHNIEVTK